METIKNTITIVVACVCLVAFLEGLTPPNPKKKRKSKKKKYSIKEICPHNIAYIKILNTSCTCETTQLTCSDCEEALEDPKTEC